MKSQAAAGDVRTTSEQAEAPRSWWKLVLTGLLAFIFGIAAVLLPANIMFGRILDVIFGHAKRFSGSMTAVAILLALVALVAIDGLVNLFGPGVMDKRAAKVRGVVGVVAAIAAVFWPGMTVYTAVELIGLWAVLVGLLELVFARNSAKDKKDRVLMIIAGIAAIVIGIGMMKWVFAGAVVISAIVGIAAVARGVSLIISGISERRFVAAKPRG
jgi:uncharacterized membrane protein HdeD (DUF308 family)